MIDLETLGTRPGCVVLSIGAVAFDRQSGQLGPEFYIVVNRRSCVQKGLLEDPSTMAWWAKQSPDAQKVLRDAETAPNGLGGALVQFTAFLEKFGKKNLNPWGCGSDFDIAILAHCYHVVGYPLPWMYWNSRCLRTLRDIAPRTPAPDRKHGVAHNALDDAKSQALEAMRIFSSLRVAA